MIATEVSVVSIRFVRFHIAFEDYVECVLMYPNNLHERNRLKTHPMDGLLYAYPKFGRRFRRKFPHALSGVELTTSYIDGLSKKRLFFGDEDELPSFSESSCSKIELSGLLLVNSVSIGDCLFTFSIRNEKINRNI